MILRNLHLNVEAGRRIVREAIRTFPRERNCECRRALATALATHPDAVPRDLRERLKPLIGKYLP